MFCISYLSPALYEFMKPELDPGFTLWLKIQQTDKKREVLSCRLLTVVKPKDPPLPSSSVYQTMFVSFSLPQQDTHRSHLLSLVCVCVCVVGVSP